MCPRTAPSIPSPGTRRCHPAPSCRRISIPTRTSISICSRANSTSCSAALLKAEFTSLRGDFKFNVNGYPIQNFYLTKVAKRPDGKFQTEIVEKVFSNYGDRYDKDCTAAK